MNASALNVQQSGLRYKVYQFISAGGCLCEFVWVLLKVYGFQPSDAAAAIRALLDTAKVAVNRPAVEAGLAMLEAGGNFADGVIAYEGQWLGGEIFVSFDKKAIARLKAQGVTTQLL